MGVPYDERRELLEALELDGASWQTPGYPAATARRCSRRARAGARGRRRQAARLAPTRPARTGAWIKVKNVSRQEFVIGGWTPGEGAAASGSARCSSATSTDDGGEPVLRYAGQVGTGFTRGDADRLARGWRRWSARRARSAAGPEPPKGAHFVEPRLVAEVEFRELDARRGCCATRLQGPARGQGRDRGRAASGRTRPRARRSTAERRQARPAREPQVEVEGRELALSNLDKVLYPKTGFTKGDLIDYYARIAAVLLPHLRDRPLTLKRYPDGVEGKYFYEKQCPSHRPDWVQTARVWSGRNKGDDRLLPRRRPADAGLAGQPRRHRAAHLAVASRGRRARRRRWSSTSTRAPPADIVDCAQVALWLREHVRAARPRAASRRPPARRACRSTSR